MVSRGNYPKIALIHLNSSLIQISEILIDISIYPDVSSNHPIPTLFPGQDPEHLPIASGRAFAQRVPPGLSQQAELRCCQLFRDRN